MAGHLYLPAGFDAAKNHAAIVVVHPGGGVKEQTAGLYAQQLAEHTIAERLTSEAKLLHHTDWSVGDIADRLGFE